MSASRLVAEEQDALRWAATGAMVPMERLELLHFLGYPEQMPVTTVDRTRAVVERILERRGFDPVGDWP